MCEPNKDSKNEKRACQKACELGWVGDKCVVNKYIM
jgi:hypothetical protein